MRHRRRGRKLGRTTAHRKATFANMAAALIEHERIETTLPKAKELRPIVERLVTLGKRNGLHARRIAASRLPRGADVGKLFGPLAERYAERGGGYTRILRTGFRHGDSAPMAIIEFVDSEAAAARAAPPEPSGDEPLGERPDAPGKPSAKQRPGKKPEKPSEKPPAEEDGTPWWRRILGRKDRY